MGIGPSQTLACRATTMRRTLVELQRAQVKVAAGSLSRGSLMSLALWTACKTALVQTSSAAVTLDWIHLCGQTGGSIGAGMHESIPAFAPSMIAAGLAPEQIRRLTAMTAQRELAALWMMLTEQIGRGSSNSIVQQGPGLPRRTLQLCHLNRRMTIETVCQHTPLVSASDARTVCNARRVGTAVHS